MLLSILSKDLPVFVNVPGTEMPSQQAVIQKRWYARVEEVSFVFLAFLDNGPCDQAQNLRLLDTMRFDIFTCDDVDCVGLCQHS